MKTAGDYALMWANGMKWPEVVASIREELLALHDEDNMGDCTALPLTLFEESDD